MKVPPDVIHQHLGNAGVVEDQNVVADRVVVDGERTRVAEKLDVSLDGIGARQTGETDVKAAGSNDHGAVVVSEFHIPTYGAPADLPECAKDCSRDLHKASHRCVQDSDVEHRVLRHDKVTDVGSVGVEADGSRLDTDVPVDGHTEQQTESAGRHDDVSVNHSTHHGAGALEGGCLGRGYRPTKNDKAEDVRQRHVSHSLLPLAFALNYQRGVPTHTR